MPGPYGDLVAGRLIVGTSVSTDDPGVICTLDGEDEGPEEKNVEWRQPLGLRSRPRDNKANAVVSQDGDYPEVISAWDPELALPGIEKGATQLHSVGDNPQLIEVADTKIKIGKDAGDTQNCARKNDHVGGGKFLAVASLAAPPPAPPITTITLTYIDADGGSHVLLAFTFAGTSITPAPAPLPTSTDIREKILEGSTLVKVEGTPG